MNQTSSLESIFFAALAKRAPAERVAFLDEACADDADLRRQVERMLQAQLEAGSFLETPAHDFMPTPNPPPRYTGEGLGEGTIDSPPIAERPGTIIGPYKLLQQIGEGGMGVVFMAEQKEPLQRTVALKIIKPGMDTRQVIARFEAERQALAMMDHPNIAKVLDAGTTSVDRSLRERENGSRSEPTTLDTGRPYFVMELVKGVPITKYCDDKHLPLRSRLELFVQVCQAVQHAHQKGVIHRDIKPNNVLVAEYDDQPVPKVIDFGVAKATAQKLTERTMFTEFGQVLGTMEYMSPEQSKFNQLDIDTRSDIYSLGVLLYELLAGSTPFEGKRLHEAAFDEMLRIIREEEPPKPSTRLSSLSLRERPGASSLPLPPGEGRGEGTLDSASIAANRSVDPKKLASIVRGDLDWIVMKALEKDRNRRYETASGFAADVIRYLNDEPVQACPPSAAYRFSKFARRNKGALVTASIVVAALLAGTAGATWQAVAAARAKQDAVAAAEAEKKAKQTAEAREAETRAVLAFVENKVFAAARPEGEEGGLGHDVTLRRAVEASLAFVESSFTDQPLIEARLRMTLGTSFRYLGEAEIAVEQDEKVRALFAQHLGPDHHNTLASMGNLANSYEALGRHADALKLREQTLALMKPKLGPDHTDTLSGMNNLANSYADVGRHADELILREETLALQKAKLDTNHPDTLRSMDNLANSYARLGRYAEALKLHEETLALRKTKLGSDHPDTMLSMRNLASSLEALGRHADALKLREETLALRKTKLGSDHPDTMLSMGDLAISYGDLGRHVDALKLGEETLALAKATLGPDHPVTLHSMNKLGAVYQAVGRYADALTLGEEMLVLRKATLGPDHPDTLHSMNNLALSYAAVGRHADALKLHEETLDLRKSKLGPDHPDTLRSMNDVAWALATNADPAVLDPGRSLELAKQAVDLAPQEGDFLNTLGVAYYRAGDWKAAVTALQKAMELRGGGDSLDWFFLAMAHRQLGNKQEARKWRQQAIEWMEKNRPDDQELRRFRAEAAKLLGITEPQTSSDPPSLEEEAPSTDDATPASPPTSDN